MAEKVVLDTPKRWKAVSHPLRLEILRVREDGDRTNEELATALHVASGKLYFHTMTLLKAGLIELSGTRQKGPLTEKLYRSLVESFTTPRTPTEEGPRYHDMLQQAFHLYHNTWREFGDFPHRGAHYIIPLTPEDAEEFNAKLGELILDYRSRKVPSDTPGALSHAFTVLFHNVRPPIEKPPTEESVL